MWVLQTPRRTCGYGMRPVRAVLRYRYRVLSQPPRVSQPNSLLLYNDNSALALIVLYIALQFKPLQTQFTYR
jgi:hypothetical protein